MSRANYYKQSEKYIGGTGQKEFSEKQLLKLKINVPSLEEQHKISEFLSLVDKKIELMEKKYKTLQKYKSALIQQIFTKNIRFSNFSNNWNYYSLGELGETYSGLTGLSKENFEQGDSKFIPYKVIFDNEVIDINSLEPVQLNNKKQEPVKKGDLFFTGSSETPEEVGMVSVLNKNIENCYLNSFCFGYRLNDFMKVNPLFLSYLLRSPLIRRKIKVLGQGSTRFNISKKEIMKLTVEIPSLEEQKKIITLLENLTNNIHFMKNKNSKIKEFKKYLLQQMNMSPNTAKTYFSKLKTFYLHFEIELPHLPDAKYNKIYETNYLDLPTKEHIRQALEIVPIDLKAIILFMSSSGTAKAETLSLTVKHFIDATQEYHDNGTIKEILDKLEKRSNIVPTFYLKRIKTDKYYYTFCSPEASFHIVKYLKTRQNLTNYLILAVLFF